MKISKRVDLSFDSCLIFNRLITIATREKGLDGFIQYELAREPLSLFKNGMMREPEKTSLRKVIMPEHNAVQREDMQSCGDYVVDDGAL